MKVLQIVFAVFPMLLIALVTGYLNRDFDAATAKLRKDMARK